MKFLQSKLFAALLGSTVFMLTTAFLTTHSLSTMPQLKHVASAQAQAVIKGPSWAFFNPELDQIISELESERQTVATREKQLQELDARLRSERAELDEALRNIKQIRDKVDREIFRIKEDELVNLKKLAKMYAAMEPDGAAKILRELDDVVVVKMMTLMKGPEIAVILDAFSRLGDDETKRAALISENLRAAAIPKRKKK
jgi:flagellar motility protein MotE (MotC chaperone)